MTPEQLATLKAAILADTNQAVIDALAIRNDVGIAELYNAATASDAWVSQMTAQMLFEASDITKFDNLSTAGKRDAWRMLLDFAPIDMTRQKNRKAVQDVWGNQDSIAVLQACTRKATKAEMALGGNSATTNTVTALKLEWEGTLSHADVSAALNAS